jgi:transcriptional regulator with XRE-family HTH domain
MTGLEFREIRTDLGLSQKALAEIFGVSYRAVREWESSKAVTGLVECAIVGVTALLEAGDQAAADAA